MQQEDAQAAAELALLRPAHAVDFLGDVLDVGVGQLSRPQNSACWRLQAKKSRS
jgi:hypothetical protein